MTMLSHCLRFHDQEPTIASGVKVMIVRETMPIMSSHLPNIYQSLRTLLNYR